MSGNPDGDDHDKLLRRVLWTMPYGLYVLGSRAGDRRNGMTINFVTQVSTAPRMIGVGVKKEAVTHGLVVAGQVFSLNLIDREEKAIVRKFVKPVEPAEGTMNGFAFHDGPTGAPVLDTAVAWVDCRLSQTVDCGDHSFFIGEVVDAGFQKPEETAVLRMEDTLMNYGG